MMLTPPAPLCSFRIGFPGILKLLAGAPHPFILLIRCRLVAAALRTVSRVRGGHQAKASSAAGTSLLPRPVPVS